ncbi:MAG: peptidoglycan DD-metalloendopeptidase family protein [Gemmatimonadetes bacterium]|nr:peptidoglycan DD-metalloendopeptidase family protein [Gemmatimonadota bacterium]
MSRVAELIRQTFGRLTRRYSVMVHAGPDSGLKHYTLPAVVIPVLLAVLLAGLVGGGLAVLRWTGDRMDRNHVAHLENENARLADQIQDFRRTVQVFESRMQEAQQLEQEFRNLANLEPIPDEVRRLGVGGPRPFTELQDEASPSPVVREARESLDRLEDLNRQVEFQQANFQEMIETLEESRSRLERIPSISPVATGAFSSGYGNRVDPFTKRTTMHRGVDFSAWTGTPVYATADGTVTKAGRQGTLGLLVEIDHGGGIETRYGHNSRVLVKVGQSVKRGDKIAEVGSTGRSTSPHCHYEVRVDGHHVNPWRYILDGGPRRNGA